MNFKFKRLYHRIFSIFLVIVLSVLSVPTSAVAKEGNEEPLNISTSAPISDSTIATDLSQEVIWPVMSDEEAMRREQLIQNGYSPDDYSVSEYKQMVAKGELQPLAVYPAVLADGVYAIKNIGNSSGSTGFYLDTALAHWAPGYNMQQYKFTNGTSPLDNFSTSALFKITRNTSSGSYVIRIMRNNALSFGIHVNTDGSNEILSKEIPLDDSAVDLNDTYSITASGSGYYIRKYGTTNLIATRDTDASGSAGAPDSYLYASSAIGDHTRWTFSAYTGPERNAATMMRLGALEVGQTITIYPVIYSTRPGYNMPYLDMSQMPSSAYTITGPTAYGRFNVTPHDGPMWNIDIYVKKGSAASAHMVFANEQTFEVGMPIDEGIYFFENAQFPGKYMQIDDDSSSSTNGAIMELWDFDADDDQRWNLDHISDGYYKITSVASGKALTAPTAVNGSVTQSTYQSLTSQKWLISKNSNGTYCLKSSERYLAAGDGIFTSDGRNVEGRSAQNDAKDEWNLRLCNEYAYVTLLMRTLYDPNLLMSEDDIEEVFNAAASGIFDEFNIRLENIYTLSCPELSFDESCSEPSPMVICNSNCAPDSTCSTNHHKAASRALYTNVSETYYTWRFVDHAMCAYDDEKIDPHYELAGLANACGKNSVVSAMSSLNPVSTLQHELSHNLGATDHDCTPGKNCVLGEGDYVNEWCPRHRAMIEDRFYE